MVKFIFQTGPNIGKEFFVTKDITLIGRGKECDIEVSDIKVSKQHCKILKRTNSYFIADLNSTNGTFLNGKAVQQVRLFSNDRIVLGDSVLIVKGDLPPRKKKGETTIIKDAYKELESGKNYEMLLAETIGAAKKAGSKAKSKKPGNSKDVISVSDDDILEKKNINKKERVIVMKQGKEIRGLSSASIIEIEGERYTVLEIRFSRKNGLIEYRLTKH